MSVAAAIREMLAAGLTVEQALVAVEAMENARGKSSGAKRQAAYRERLKAKAVTSRDVTSVTTVTPEPETLPPPVSPLSPSPKPLTQNPPLSPTNPTAGAGAEALDGELLLPIAKPKPPPNAARGCRIPPGFPGDDERDWCKQNLGMTDDHCDECFAEFGDFWTGVPGSRGLKCDWPATLRNAARKYAARLRPRQAYAAGNQRSDGSLLGAHQRAAARIRAQNDVPRQRAGVFDHRERELEMHYGIPAE